MTGSIAVLRLIIYQARCDDPEKLCTKDYPDKDPCKPPPGENEPKAGQYIAYAINDNADGYPSINFCKIFFDKRSLSNAVSRGTALSPPLKYDIRQYDNRGEIRSLIGNSILLT